MNSKEKTMREEARAAIIEALRYGYTGYYCDLHDEVFNTDYYIIGIYEAKKALEEYDVFKAIEKIQTYEKDNFGEVYTDLSDPEKLVNMLFYIIGEEVLWEMLEDSETLSENWDNQADEETNAAILEELGENMKKIVAKEVNPADVDFSFYFDDDGLKNAGGENCAVYIVPADERRNAGFNMEEYREIELHAQAVIDDYEAGHPIDEALKEWAEYANVYDTEDIAEFLTITTGEKWEVRSFFGYSQGDCVDVVYCVNRYTPEHITEIGELWLGCGTEFCIDGCCGYYVPNSIRWREGETLRKYLADSYGCEPDELEIYLYDGEKYEKMD